MPARRHAARLSALQSVGLASIVISSGRSPAAKRWRICAIAAATQSGRHSDGVPPPR